MLEDRMLRESEQQRFAEENFRLMMEAERNSEDWTNNRRIAEAYIAELVMTELFGGEISEELLIGEGVGIPQYEKDAYDFYVSVLVPRLAEFAPSSVERNYLLSKMVVHLITGAMNEFQFLFARDAVIGDSAPPVE